MITCSCLRFKVKTGLSSYQQSGWMVEDLGGDESLMLCLDRVCTSGFWASYNETGSISSTTWGKRSLGTFGPARQKVDAEGVSKEDPVAPGSADEDEEMPQAVPPPPRAQGERIA
nr:hypothetical protein [Tanacetum cinerariifolium]